ncbi:Rpn family recombination-promoting nuclease/putative transposase [Spirosoma gilvum]
MKHDDTLWKAIIEDIFEDFLRFFFPNTDDLFALEKGVEYLDKELEQLFPPDQDAYSPRYVDKLVKVFVRADDQIQEQWILIHIEVQGYKDSRFAERMFQYYYRIFDKYQQPITAFAIFTDGHKGYQPAHYERVYLGTKLHYQYNTYKILEQQETELLTSNNPFALVVLTVKAALTGKKLTEDQLVELKIQIAKVLLSSQLQKAKIRSLMNFLRYYVRLENPETNRKFDTAIEALTATNTTMGIEQFLLDRAKKEGLQEGVEKGFEQGIEQEKRVIVTRLLEKTSFSNEQIADIADVPVTFVEQLRKDL